jgi:hypothetical protein
MAQGTCSIEGCEKTGVLTRTWCVNHYARYRRWGDWWNLTRACLRCNRSKGPHCGTWFILKRGGVDESGLAAAVA